jgi:hypothetical protein
MQIGDCNDKDFRIQYLINNPVRETTQLTSAGGPTEGMPGVWKTPDSFKSIQISNKNESPSPEDSEL